MKNNVKISVAFFLVFLMNTCFAQQQEQTRKVLWNFHVGANESTIFNNGDYTKLYLKYKPLAGFIGGVGFHYELKPRLALLLELNYERKGYQIVYSNFPLNNGSLGKTSLHSFSHYIVLPVMAKIYLTKKKNNLFLNLGIYSGYCFARNWIHVPAYSIAAGSSGESSPVSKYFNVFDLGIVSGLGFCIPTSEKQFFSFELRNNIGLLTAGKNYQYASNTSKNESLGLLIGYTF